jgi:hypothetical protein
VFPALVAAAVSHGFDLVLHVRRLTDLFRSNDPLSTGVVAHR